MGRVRQTNILPPCQYNHGVECEEKNRCCDICGWNPDVEKERLNKWLREHQVDAKPEDYQSKSDEPESSGEVEQDEMSISESGV